MACKAKWFLGTIPAGVLLLAAAQLLRYWKAAGDFQIGYLEGVAAVMLLIGIAFAAYEIVQKRRKKKNR